MAANFVYATVIFLLSLIQANGLEAIDGRIKITVGTTAGCSDTVRFIGEQLSEAYSLYGNFLDVEFVPWGRTIWNETGMFCQFQEPDCWANRLHRCVLNMLRNNQAAQVHYMTCEFTGPFGPAFTQGSYLCAQAVGVRLIEVDYCVANPGDDLDREAQASASAPMTQINFVPSIVFNDFIDLDLHNQARTRLSSMICIALAADPSTGIQDCQI